MEIWNYYNSTAVDIGKNIKIYLPKVSAAQMFQVSSTLLKIGTEDQIADMFTKGVIERLFVPLRNTLMGWDPQEK